jgi:rare lipoprotein A
MAVLIYDQDRGIKKSEMEKKQRPKCSGIVLSFCLVFSMFSFFSCHRIALPPAEPFQTGLASWYGPDFHGQTTSSKEVYDMYDLTAAHKSLPFGTYVVVTNMDNGKSVTVRINDRGPFIEGRIIDLSYAAAKALDMLGPGVVPVKIEILEEYSPKRSSQKFSVQVGAFVQKKNASGLKDELKKTYKNVYISRFQTTHQTYYRVRIRAETMDAAKDIARRLTNEGYPAIVLEEQ